MGKKTSGKGVDKELRDSAQKIWLAGLGALAVAEQEGSKMFNRLVDRGRDWEEQGKEKAQARVKEGVESAKSRFEKAVDEVEEKVDQKVTEAMKRLGVPGRDEIRDLTSKVEELNAKIEALHGKPAPEAKAEAKPKAKAKPKASPKGKASPKA
jgi:poly(hydroxyalkanoate) granule-associated protein